MHRPIFSASATPSGWTACSDVTRREGARTGQDRGGVLYGDWRLVDRVTIDRGIADVFQRPSNDAEVGLRCGDIIKAAEEEQAAAIATMMARGPTRLRNFIAKPLVCGSGFD